MSLTTWHRYRDSIRWRLADKGVEVRGSGLERTPGEPLTITRIWEDHGDDINRASQEFGVPAVLILATTATESGGRTRAVREEPRYVSDEETPDRVSSGMMQTLISTAQDTLNDPSITRQWLFTPLNSLRAGTAYIAQQKGSTNHDPPKVAAAYNAGGVYHRPQDTVRANRWQMRQYPLGTGEHVDRFVRWFNDAVAVLESHPKRPAIPYEVLLSEKAPPVAPPPKRVSAKIIIKPGVRLESDEAKAIVQTLRDAALEGAIPTCRITSSYRSNSKGFHGRAGTNGRGTAVDVGGPEPGINTQEMADIFLALAKPKLPDGRYVANELIYAGPQIDFNVDQHMARFKYAEALHRNHVHCAVEKGVFMEWPGGGLPDLEEEEDDEMIKYALIQPKGGGPTFGMFVTPEAVVVGKKTLPPGVLAKVGFTNGNVVEALKKSGYIPSDHIQMLELDEWERIPHLGNV